jgi:hypothetical protein
MDFQPAVVVNESQFSEPVHEESDPRAGCAYHLGEGLLTDRGDYAVGDAVLTEVSKQEEDPRQPLSLELKTRKKDERKGVDE